MPWELKKGMTLTAFAASAAAGVKSQALGPTTIRKLSVPMIANLILTENSLSLNSQVNNDITNKDGEGNGDNAEARSIASAAKGGAGTVPNSSYAPKTVNASSSNVSSISTSTSNMHAVLTSFAPSTSQPYQQISSYNTAIEALKTNAQASSTSNQVNFNASSSTGDKIKNLINKVQDSTVMNVQKGLDVVRESASTIIHSTSSVPTNPFLSNTGVIKSSGTRHSTDNTNSNNKIFDKETLKNIFSSPIVPNKSNDSLENSTTAKKSLNVTQMFRK